MSEWYVTNKDKLSLGTLWECIRDNIIPDISCGYCNRYHTSTFQLICGCQKSFERWWMASYGIFLWWPETWQGVFTLSDFFRPTSIGNRLYAGLYDRLSQRTNVVTCFPKLVNDHLCAMGAPIWRTYLKWHGNLQPSDYFCQCIFTVYLLWHRWQPRWYYDLGIKV